MHTHDRTITPSAHLPTVEALLAKLDEMKGKVGAKQRLEFLLEKGPEVVPGFDFEDAFDLSRQAHTERVQKLEDLSSTMNAMTAKWHDSSLEDEVKKAGDRLIRHLSEFVKQARNKEDRSEIETLSSLWEDAPDVFPAFNLPTPSYYPKNVIEKVTEPEGAEVLQVAKGRLIEEVVRENAASTELPDDIEKKVAAAFEMPDEEEQLEGIKEMCREAKNASDDDLGQLMDGGPAAGITTGMIDQTKEELEKLGVHVPTQFGGRPGWKGASSEYGEVVRQVSTRPHEFKPDPSHQQPVDAPAPAPEELEAELDMLDIRSWTLAINEILASNWKFDRQLRGRIGDRARSGITLIWTKDSSNELRLDVERLAPDEVLVRLVPPRSAKTWAPEESPMYQLVAKEMTVSALEELHKDPSEFVKLILRLCPDK